MTPEHELESEDDEAPEEVTFQSAKTRAQENARARREAAIREKALLKEKRKRKEELFKEQKKKKLLPDDILQSISAHPEKREEPSKQHEDLNTTVNEEVVKKRANKVVPRKRLQINYQVVQLDDYSKRDLLQQRAKSFLRGKLYGKTKNRTTASEFLSLSRKRGVVKKPAVQFMGNTWDEETKQKATKFKLQWADKKKL